MCARASSPHVALTNKKSAAEKETGNLKGITKGSSRTARWTKAAVVKAEGRRYIIKRDKKKRKAGSRMPVQTPSQRDLAAAHEERGVVIFACSVSMIFGE